MYTRDSRSFHAGMDRIENKFPTQASAPGVVVSPSQSCGMQRETKQREHVSKRHDPYRFHHHQPTSPLCSLLLPRSLSKATHHNVSPLHPPHRVPPPHPPRNHPHSRHRAEMGPTSRPLISIQCQTTPAEGTGLQSSGRS